MKPGTYRTSLGRHLLTVETVVDAVVKTVGKPVREVNLPWYMGITSKMHAVAPTLVERLGRKYFMKKNKYLQVNCHSLQGCGVFYFMRKKVSVL